LLRWAITNVVANLRNAFISKLVRSIRKAHFNENLLPLTSSFSARSSICGHRHIKWLKVFCKMLTKIQSFLYRRRALGHIVHRKVFRRTFLTSEIQCAASVDIALTFFQWCRLNPLRLSLQDHRHLRQTHNPTEPLNIHHSQSIRRSPHQEMD